MHPYLGDKPPRQRAGDVWKISLTVQMGRNRVVRRMVAEVGFKRMEQLHRERIGTLLTQCLPAIR